MRKEEIEIGRTYHLRNGDTIKVEGFDVRWDKPGKPEIVIGLRTDRDDPNHQYQSAPYLSDIVEEV